MAEVKDYIIYVDDRGTINISEDVVAAAAGSAAVEVDGISCLYNTPGREFADIVGRKGLSKGVKIQINDNVIDIDISVVAELGTPVSKVGEKVQDAVKSAVEASTGLAVNSVNVHICGIALKKR